MWRLPLWDMDAERHDSARNAALEPDSAPGAQVADESAADPAPDVQHTSEEVFQALLQELGEQDASKKVLVHLLTFSRLLPDTLEGGDLRNVSGLSRQEVAVCVWKAFDNPVPAGAGRRGRPCTRTEGLVSKLVVFREQHEDGDYHFHVAVLLRQPRTFASAKRTLRVRDGLVAHFSSSHTQFWSAVRYGYTPTAKKPLVDSEPLSWGPEGWNSLDLYEESQQPWTAEIWKRRREAGHVFHGIMLFNQRV